MALALTVTSHWTDGKKLHVTGILTASGNYPATGDAVPLTSPLIKTRALPIYAHAYGASSVYEYQAVKNGSNVPAVKVTTRSTGTELAAGAYPAGITGDTISIYIILDRMEH